MWGLALAVALFASVLVHELAHSLYGLHAGGKIRSITLLMIGGVSEMSELPPRTRDEAIMALDAPRTTAVAAAYLESGANRSAYMSTVALAACKFQDDPHNQKISHSAFEEYAHNSTHRRDQLLIAAARLVAGWTKMPGERECFARFTREWMN